MEAIIFALVSYIGWGVGDIFNVFVARKLGAYSTSFFVYFRNVFNQYILWPLRIS